MVYESCIDYVLISNDEFFIITGFCDKEELSFYKDELIRLIKIVEKTEYLPERYKSL
jgi:hypothetical protein